jgi:hypothetical protein
LFKTPDEARAALAGWPLGESNILNVRDAKAADHQLKQVDKISNLTVSESTDLSKMLKEKMENSSPRVSFAIIQRLSPIPFSNSAFLLLRGQGT